MNLTEHLLIILAEECNEVAQRCSKALRFGLYEKQPGQDKTNAYRIIEELSDLSGVWQMLRDQERLPSIDPSLSDAKKAKVESFLNYSLQCNTLEDDQAGEITDDDVITVARWLPHIASRDIRTVIRFGLARMGRNAADSPELATQIAEAWLS